MMKRFFLGVLLAFFLTSTVGGSLAYAQGTAIDNTPVTQAPVALMKHWKASTDMEKMAYLFGMATMLGVEKGWQGDPPPPLNTSLTSVWTKGLEGITFSQLRGVLDDYALAHPEDNEKHVLEILWKLRIAPTLTPEMKKSIQQLYNLKNNRQ